MTAYSLVQIKEVKWKISLILIRLPTEHWLMTIALQMNTDGGFLQQYSDELTQQFIGDT